MAHPEDGTPLKDVLHRDRRQRRLARIRAPQGISLWWWLLSFLLLAALQFILEWPLRWLLA